MARKRAVHVCEPCHNHKIRCDVDETGIPCSKCTEIGEKCRIRVRKQYSARKRQKLSGSPNRDEDEESPAQPDAESQKIVEAAIPHPSNRIAPIFVGDGGYGAILDATRDKHERLFYIPAAAEKALPVEDLEYLKVKGCFSLPYESKELLKLYFQFVHPTFPVIDAKAFLDDYAAGGLESVNLLLLWSMFSISASYHPDLPRKARKKEYVQRAKILFDLSQENDKLVLVQSALLLSFWFENTEDVKQSWYWTSIAFGIAQTLGLHREIRSTHSPDAFQRRLLWRNVWQCCIVRDVWLAFGMGRPLRINAADCVQFSPEDSDHTLSKLSLHEEMVYTSEEEVELSNLWGKLLLLSKMLRDIITDRTALSTNARTVRVRLEKEMETWRTARFGGQNTGSRITVAARLNIELHQTAAKIELARTMQSQEDAIEEAEYTMYLIAQFSQPHDLIICAAPVAVPLVLPAAVHYLGVLKNGTTQTKKHATEQLRLIKLFLCALENSYPAASILKGVLNAAEDAISKHEPEGVVAGDGQDLATAPNFLQDYWLSNSWIPQSDW